jgi:putative FmdB family regulatory protein
MPNYEYECNSCGIHFDRLQHFKDDPLKECPECGGAVHRVLQPVGIIFKGSGFYVTDHNKASSVATPGHKAAETAKDTEEKKTSPAPESKPAESSTKEKAKAAD